VKLGDRNRPASRTVDTLPGWLQTLTRVNPVSLVVSALRDLMNDGAFTVQVVWALVGCATVAAIFVSLSVRSFSKRF
jgi:ABC-2 type transport system permease protein